MTTVRVYKCNEIIGALRIILIIKDHTNNSLHYAKNEIFDVYFKRMGKNANDLILYTLKQDFLIDVFEPDVFIDKLNEIGILARKEREFKIKTLLKSLND